MPAAIVGRAAIKPRVRTDPALSPRPERSRHQIAGAAPACEATRSCILDKARRSVESTDVGASVGRWRPYVLSILRIVVALLFLQHGLSKFFGFPAPDHGRPLVMLLREGQMSDYKGAALMPPAMPKAKQLLADKGHDADWFRAALAKRRIAACIPSKSNRKTAIPYDAVLYKQRHKIENMFARLKDWRRIHTRYDRCAHTYLSAICIAATVVFWL